MLAISVLFLFTVLLVLYVNARFFVQFKRNFFLYPLILIVMTWDLRSFVVVNQEDEVFCGSGKKLNSRQDCVYKL